MLEAERVSYPKGPQPVGLEADVRVKDQSFLGAGGQCKESECHRPAPCALAAYRPAPRSVSVHSFQLCRQAGGAFCGETEAQNLSSCSSC